MAVEGYCGLRFLQYDGNTRIQGGHNSFDIYMSQKAIFRCRNIGCFYATLTAMHVQYFCIDSSCCKRHYALPFRQQ